jgi:hypothetical protein
MSKTIKNLLIVFTLLCTIAVVVFTVELLILNRGGGDGETDPALSDNQPSAGGGSAGGEQAQAGEGPTESTGQPGETGQQADNGQPDGPRPPPTGTMNERLMPGNNTRLVFYTDGEVLDHTMSESEDILDIFSLKTDQTSRLEIRFAFFPHDVREFAGRILYDYIDRGISGVGDEVPIRRSSISGVFVSGENNGVTYEAWIYSFSDHGYDDIGLAFIINYRNDEQRDALYAVLDTLEMVTA